MSEIVREVRLVRTARGGKSGGEGAAGIRFSAVLRPEGRSGQKREEDDRRHNRKGSANRHED